MSKGWVNGMSVCVETILATAEADKQDSGFAARVAENQRRIFQIAYGVLRNSSDAEEVAQEAFLRAYRNFASLRDPEKFRAWVSRIAFRLALNRIRQHRRRADRDRAWQTASAKAAVDGAQSAEEYVLLERLWKEIAGLPEKFRVVLLLSLTEDMDAAAVGAILRIPAGTVRSRLHAARKLLLKVMA